MCTNAFAECNMRTSHILMRMNCYFRTEIKYALYMYVKSVYGYGYTKYRIYVFFFTYVLILVCLYGNVWCLRNISSIISVDFSFSVCFVLRELENEPSKMWKILVLVDEEFYQFLVKRKYISGALKILSMAVNSTLKYDVSSKNRKWLHSLWFTENNTRNYHFLYRLRTCE